MTRQQFPESQRDPFGPNQLAWLTEHYGKAFFRDAKPMVEHTNHGEHDAAPQHR